MDREFRIWVAVTAVAVVVAIGLYALPFVV